VGLRVRKRGLTSAIKAYERLGLLSREEADGFRGMYAKARSYEEQDQVRAALLFRFDGWKTASDRISRILQYLNDDPED
jgi:hypothetical protein